MKTNELVVILDRPMSQEEYMPLKRAIERMRGVEAVGRAMTDEEKTYFYKMKNAGLAAPLTPEQIKAISNN